MKEPEKDKYEEMYEDEKFKYKSDLELKHYLFCDYNNDICSPLTAYRIFWNERLREGINKRIAPQKIKIKVKSDWDKMSAKKRKN